MTPAERSLVILVAIMILYITELIPLADNQSLTFRLIQDP